MLNEETNKVVGLSYEPDDGLPRIILKGNGKTADAIIKSAKSGNNGPEIVQDKELLKKLYRLPIDAEIGPELFHLVAMILAHIFAIEEKMKRKKHG
jgi:type III secretion system FlhB-like substrate exporter